MSVPACSRYPNEHHGFTNRYGLMVCSDCGSVAVAINLSGAPALQSNGRPVPYDGNGRHTSHSWDGKECKNCLCTYDGNEALDLCAFPYRSLAGKAGHLLPDDAHAAAVLMAVENVVMDDPFPVEHFPDQESEQIKGYRSAMNLVADQCRTLRVSLTEGPSVMV